MQIGITGHQHRPGISWPWVTSALKTEIEMLQDVTKALSSLAVGADQVFAELALRKQIPVLAVIPTPNYSVFFKEDDLRRYKKLLQQCETIELDTPGDDEHRFYEAGKFIVRNSDLLFAVWDGENSQGVGGTGDIVRYAKENNRAVVHINPITTTTTRLSM
jgi:hypothetical protein